METEEWENKTSSVWNYYLDLMPPQKNKNRKTAKHDGRELLHSNHMLRLIFSRKTAFSVSVSGEEHLAEYKS